mgnify:CR=1 FL=1
MARETPMQFHGEKRRGQLSQHHARLSRKIMLPTSFLLFLFNVPLDHLGLGRLPMEDWDLLHKVFVCLIYDAVCKA